MNIKAIAIALVAGFCLALYAPQTVSARPDLCPNTTCAGTWVCGYQVGWKCWFDETGFCDDGLCTN